MAATANRETLVFKSKAVLQQHLLGDPLSVSPKDYDPDRVDDSPEHRQEMRQKLYGQKRVQYDPAKRAPNPNEALSSLTNYADEDLPPWKSTTKEEFSEKKAPSTVHVARETANLMNRTHIYLESPGGDQSKISCTKQDYIRHAPNKPACRHIGNPVKNPYSLIECQEMLPPSPKIKKTTYIPKPRVNERISWEADETAKAISHISFGNAGNDWKSVSKQSLVAHPPQEKPAETEYESLEKKKSTVLDNPDLVLDSIQTVNQSVFTMDAFHAKKDLSVDDKLSRKALNGTHFTLGNGDDHYTRSEYVSSFLQLPYEKSKPMRAYNSSRLAIIAEHYEDRKMGQTSQKHDYQPPPQFLGVNTAEVKKANSKSSIVLGQEGVGLSQATSLTKADYKSPSSVDPSATAEKYKIGGKVLDHPKGVSFQSLVGMEGNHGPYKSIHQADYIVRAGTAEVFREAKSMAKNNQLDYTSVHYMAGSSDRPKPEDQMLSVTKKSFVNPQSIPVSNVAYAGAHGTDRPQDRINNSFDVTIENTVTRYPYYKDTYSSTFSSAFQPPTNSTRRLPFEPAKTNQLHGHLHPQLVAIETKNGLEFKHIRELSSVSRRTYVAPEVMKER